MTVDIGSVVWVDLAFIEGAGEPIDRVMRSYVVIDVSVHHIKLEGWDVWVPRKACKQEGERAP